MPPGSPTPLNPSGKALRNPRRRCSYKAFPPDIARAIAKRIQFHFVPKHASWLNMAEIEIGVLRKQCLDRRIEDKATMASEIAAWEKARNSTWARVRWMFSVDIARAKLGDPTRP